MLDWGVRLGLFGALCASNSKSSNVTPVVVPFTASA
jgi:hypothetical protein